MITTIYVNASIEGHNYLGYSMSMSEWSEFDNNSDVEITFRQTRIADDTLFGLSACYPINVVDVRH
jgi:hypothetical protein